MTLPHALALLRRRLCTLCLASAALLPAAPAAALPVSAQIDNLPPGLTVQLQPRRCVTGDFNGPQSQMQTPPIDLRESSFTVYEPVTSATGQTTLRARVLTRYSGQAEVDPDPPAQVGLLACDRVVPGSEVLRFALAIHGQGSGGQAATRELHLGQTFNRVNPVALRRTLSGSSALLNPPTQVPRLTRLQFEVQHSNPFSTPETPATQVPSLELRRAVPLPGSLLSTVQVTRVFIDADGRRCIRSAANVTRCSGGTPLVAGLLVHGGVALDVKETRPRLVGGTERTVFVLALDSSFAPGELTLRASADDRDPMPYLVDEVPTELDLLPWRADSVPLRVL